MLFISFGTWAVELLAPALLDGQYVEVLWLFIACLGWHFAWS